MLSGKWVKITGKEAKSEGQFPAKPTENPAKGSKHPPSSAPFGCGDLHEQGGDAHNRPARMKVCEAPTAGK